MFHSDFKISRFIKITIAKITERIKTEKCVIGLEFKFVIHFVRER